MLQTYDIFLSHNNAEKPAVEYIARQIVNEGFRPWLDKWELPAGKTWQDGIELGLKNSKACAAFVGPHGITKWHQEEIWIANRMRVETGTFPVIPVLLPGISAADCQNLPSVLGNTTWVKFTDLDDRQALMQLIAGVVGKAPVPVDAASSAVCPYRGLRFFDVEHSALFFGRDVLTNKLLKAIAPAEGHRENRFVGVLGPSGSGKSSVARAGLIARIKAGAFPESNNWPVVIFRPGKDPLESLGTALLKSAGFSYGTRPGDLIADLASNENTLHLASISMLKAGSARRVVVFVDQFEELFTQCESPDLRRAFIHNILYASQVLDGHVIAVLAMRSDFYGRCAEFARLATALSQPGSHFLVGAMEEHELEQTIVEPARLAGCRIDPQVVQRVLLFASRHQGCLPLIQDVLTDLWQKRTGNVISLDAYRAAGGVEGALGRRADDAFTSLDEPGRKICERIFLRLVVFTGGAYVKRPVEFSRLLPAESTEADQRRIEQVIELLAGPEARVIVVENDAPGAEAAGERVIEIVHESLIDAWPRLKNWLSSDQEFQLWRRRMESANEEWLRVQKDPDLLLRGASLAEAARWLRERPQDLNTDEQSYIREGIHAQQQREESERERQRALLDAEKQRADAEQARAEAQTKVAKRTKMLALSAIAFVAATGAAGAFSLVASARASDAASNRLAAIARNQVAASPGTALLLALHSVRFQPGKAAFESLQYTYQASRRPLVEEPEVLRIAYSRDGQLLASAHADGALRIWNVSSGRASGEPLPHPGRVEAVVFSPSGDLVASGCADGIVRVWKLSSGTTTPFFQTSVQDGAVMSVDFNRDSSLLAGAHWSGKVRLWRLTQAQPVVEYSHDAPAAAVSFHPTVDKVVAGYTDGAVLVWASDSGQAQSACKTTEKISDVRFGPGGNQVAVAAGTLALVCEPGSGKPAEDVGGDPVGVAAVALSSDGTRVAAAGRSGTFQVFDMKNGEESLRLAFDSSPLTAIAFQPGLDAAKTEILAVGGKDGVRVYELQRDALRTLARDQTKALNATLTKEQCTQYLRGKDCSILP